MDFQIAPSPPSTVLFAAGIAAITLSIALLFIWFAWSASKLSVSVDDSNFTVKVPIYGRSIALTQLDMASARILDLQNTTELRPRARSNGIGLPGYAVGWFKLNNGEKALAAITNKNNVLYLKTHEGYSLLLSLTHPNAVLQQLHNKTMNNGG